MRTQSVFLFLLLVVKIACAQSLKVPVATEKGQVLCAYRLSYQPDSMSLERRSEMMRLTLGKTTSKFESEGTYLSDSIQSSMADIPDNQANTQLLVDKLSMLPHSRFGFKIIKDRSANKIYAYDMIGTKIYKYDDDFPAKYWKIGTETAVISGYACQKATIAFGGRVFQAWFTRELPFSDGPYKFYGLPGLIVRLSDTRGQYIFELVKLRQLKQTLLITLPERAAITTKKALQQGKRDYYAGLSARTTGIVTASPSAETRQSERVRIAKRFNNALELH